jgi:hypothetical protein
MNTIKHVQQKLKTQSSIKSHKTQIQMQQNLNSTFNGKYDNDQSTYLLKMLYTIECRRWMFQPTVGSIAPLLYATIHPQAEAMCWKYCCH